MTPKEVQEWLEHLAPTDEKRAATIRELLRHATEDEMSAEDWAICIQCLKQLGGKRYSQDGSPPRHDLVGKTEVSITRPPNFCKEVQNC